MMNFVRLNVFVFFFFVSVTVRAQVFLEGLASGRYEKKAVATQSSTKVQKRNVSSELPVKSIADEAVPEVVSSVPEKSVQTEPTLVEQAESLIKGKPEQVLEFYEKNLPSDDQRKNKFELSLAAGIFNESAKSDYSFRDHTLKANSLNVKGQLWLTPALGGSASFLTTLPTDLKEASSADAVSVQKEELEIAMQFRKFFLSENNPASLVFALSYLDDQLTVPSSSVTRAKLNHSGLGVLVNSKIPMTEHLAMNIGAKLYPSLSVKETSQQAISSGSFDTGSMVALSLGNEYRFSRHDVIFWEVQYQNQKSLYSGSSEAAEPSEGRALENVAIENQVYLFSLGYRWGK